MCSNPSPPTVFIMKRFKPFQIRWAEKLGENGRPYLIRWTFLFFNYSIRIHHWLKSDDKRCFHNHSCDFVSFVLKGRYQNITPNGVFPVKTGSIWKSKAEDWHYLDIPKEGAWTLMFCGKPYRRWGFLVDGKQWNPRRYLKKFGEVHE